MISCQPQSGNGLDNNCVNDTGEESRNYKNIEPGKSALCQYLESYLQNCFSKNKKNFAYKNILKDILGISFIVYLLLQFFKSGKSKCIETEDSKQASEPDEKEINFIRSDEINKALEFITKRLYEAINTLTLSPVEAVKPSNSPGNNITAETNTFVQLDEECFFHLNKNQECLDLIVENIRLVNFSII